MSNAGFVTLNPKFENLLAPGAELKQLATGYEFLEGPAWHPRLAGLVFSDIPANRMHMWTPHGGVRPFRDPSNHANGNAVDSLRRLWTCEHETRRVVRAEADGSVTVLADSFDGKRLNSPNDITVQGDGTAWFTDPPYGIQPEQQELPGCYVYRLDPDGTLSVVATDFIKPNGICFSPDESLLYVSDTAAERHHIRRFTVNADKTLSGGEVFAEIEPGKSDGFRIDTYGRIWTSTGEGIWVISAAGELWGKILVPEVPSNCCFGGRGFHTLYITARTSLYTIELNVMGAKIW